MLRATQLIFVEIAVTTKMVWNEAWAKGRGGSRKNAASECGVPWNSSTLSHYRKRRGERARRASGRAGGRAGNRRGQSVTRESVASLSAIPLANSLFARDSTSIISTRALVKKLDQLARGNDQP